MPAPAPRTGTVRDAAAGITVLAVANFVAITTEVLPVGLLPQLARGVGVTESTAGLLVTVYALVVAAFAVPLTLATQRFPRKPLLLVTLVVYVAGNLLVAVAPSYGVVAAGRTLGGLGHAVFFSVSIAYAARLVSPLYTGRALTLVTAGGTLGFVLGVPLSTSLGAAVGWRWSFAVLAGVCAVTALLVARLLPAVQVEAAPARDRSGARQGRRRLGVVVGTNTLLFGGHYAVYTYISVLLLATGLSEASVGPVLLVFGALGLLGLWAAARYLDRAPRTLTLAAMSTIVVALALLAVALPHPVGVLLAGGLWLAAFGAIPATFQAAALRTQGASADIAGAFVNATSNLGIGLGAALGAVVLAGPGMQALAATGAGVVALAAVAVLTDRGAFPRDPTAAPDPAR
ncbi:MFS transporter [Isoptericola halotolerans]|uniref:MFS family arabinose efflux permease n=1 Tax=Isoptericola halotolerans TaxID=300560 RepID=A0ABX2A4L0_9MICO|nr:putative MFS family arabinose efflux permease [Isoptericola halotolerans]